MARPYPAFYMSSNTLPDPQNFCVHTLPQCFRSCLATNRPHVQLTMLCYTKSAKQNYINIDKQLDKKNKKNLEYINTKDVGL